MAVFMIMMLFIMAMFCSMHMLMFVNVCFPVMLMRVFMPFFLLQNHIKITGIDPAFFRPSDPDLIPFERQCLQRFPEGLLSGAKIQKRTHSHITADTGITFQI